MYNKSWTEISWITIGFIQFTRKTTHCEVELLKRWPVQRFYVLKWWPIRRFLGGNLHPSADFWPRKLTHSGRTSIVWPNMEKQNIHLRGFDRDMIFSHPTSKVLNSAYMQYYFKRFFCFAFLRSYIFISDQKVKAKNNRNRNCIFSSTWESQASHIGSFL